MQGWLWKDGNVGPKTPSATPFYMVQLIWGRNHGSVTPLYHGVNLADLIH
jgi:hypothetical protein